MTPEAGPDWSPDGKRIAYAVGAYGVASRNTLMTARLEDGAEQPLGTASWFRVVSVLWLPDGGGLIVGGYESQSSPLQLWRVSYPDGAVRRLTSDLNDYLPTSVTRDGATLLAYQDKDSADIWAGAPGAEFRQLTFTKNDGKWGLGLAPDGRVVFGASDGEQLSIWVMNADGTGRRQLTGGAKDWLPGISPDGRYVVFSSARSGAPNIWRVDMEGRDLRPMTAYPSEDNRARYTGDGRWITFMSYRTAKTTIWRMPAEGGKAAQLSDQPCAYSGPSPDGRFVACVDKEAPDGRAIAFVQTRDGAQNIWRMPLEGGNPVQLTFFKPALGVSIPIFAYSPDGRTLAVTRATHTSEIVVINNFR